MFISTLLILLYRLLLMLGRLYLFGYGVERDEDKFNSLKLKSCELGYEKGCELSDEIDTPKE